MSLPYALINTFTTKHFKGNPTPVCVLNNPINTRLMLRLTKEFGFPVMAFVLPKEGTSEYSIRYFTITGEIAACGHATLAAAKFLFTISGRDNISFRTIENIGLNPRLEGDMTFVEYPKFNRLDAPPPEGLLRCLGVSNYKACFFCNELETLFIETGSLEELSALSPDFEGLKKCTEQIKEVVVMCRSCGSPYDFLLRSFCPWIGIDEDQVTGSVHSVLAHYWQEQLHKYELVAFQISDRGGTVFLRPKEKSVELGGQCKILLSGELNYDIYT